MESRRLSKVLSHLGMSPVLAVIGSPTSDLASAAATGLSAEQLESYVQDGYVVVSGLIPEPILAAARDSIWDQMAGPPKPPEEDAWAPGGAKKRERPRPQRNNRRSWPTGGWEGMVDGEAIAALFTPQWHEAAQTLASAAAEVSACSVLTAANMLAYAEF